jgi:multidrug efflux pump subunit AcrA (membrane-fusion protein)
VIAVAVIVAGITQIGTSTSSAARTSTEDVTAADGVVQSTVSGSGNVEPGVEDDVNFQTSGTLTGIYVKVGQHVKKGQLIATLDPSSAKLTLEEAETTLAAAEDQLTADEESTSSTSSSSSGSSGSSGVSGTTASVASVRRPRDSSGTGTTTTAYGGTTTGAFPSTTTTGNGTTTTGNGTTTTGNGTTTTGTETTTTPGTPQTTTSASTTPSTTSSTAGTTDQSSSGSGTKSTKKTTPATSKTGAGSATTTTTSTTTTTETAAQKAQHATEVAQAKEQVQADENTVTADKKAVSETHLYAPASGTIASLTSDSVGDTVSSGGTSGSGSGSSSTSTSSSFGSASTGSSSSSSSSSSAFAEIINDSTMSMTVSLSEDDITSVKVGQVATVSITALSGVELGGRVTSISPIGTESSSVVSYDATVTIYQSNSKVLPGMSATASIITGQQQGVTVPSDAVSGSGTSGTVQMVKDGKTVSQPVTLGLKGTSRDVITSGLSAGDEVQVTITLPSLGTSTTSSTSGTSGASGFGGGSGGFAALRAQFGGGGFGGGGFGGGGGG